MANTGITLFGSYKSVLKKYVDFNGRLSRKGYWYFFLANFLISLAVSVAEFIFANGFVELTSPSSPSITDFTLFSSIYSLILLLPAFAASVRRLHDTNRSGWNYLLLFIPIVGWIVVLVFLFKKGDQQENKYGPVPTE